MDPATLTPSVRSPELPVVAPQAEALVFGVCSALADRLGTSVALVRASAVTLAATNGVGFVVYLVLASCWKHRSATVRVRAGRRDAGLVLVTTGLSWELTRQSSVLPTTVVLSTGLLVFGVAFAWSTNAPRPHGNGVFSRLGLAAACLFGGLATLLVSQAETATFQTATLVAGVSVAALSVIGGPTLLRFVNANARDRRQRIRAEERAAVAMHLHDSVLQTLTLIQRRAHDPAATVTLARHEERALRRWLYEDADDHPDDEPSTVRTAVERTVGEIEDSHGVPIELVTVGDGPVTPTDEALIAAAREALVNAAKFSGAERISMYCEWTPTQRSLFVRDRGCGFDTHQVAPDRRGIQDSIIARVQAVGGTAHVRSAVGDGTEVVLTAGPR